MSYHKINVSFAQENDRNETCKLAKQSHSESFFSAIPFSEDKFNRFFDTAKNKKAIMLVAKINGKAIGFSYATIGEYFIGENDKVATILVLYVKSEIRHTLAGGKVALKLFKAVKQIAKKEKAEHMLTHVTSGVNITSTDRFFRKIGAKTLGGNYVFKL